jgi:hypothetical protein
MNEIMKYCPECKTEKLASEFTKHRSRKDGLNWECRSCQAKRRKRYAVTNREKNQQLNARQIVAEKFCNKCQTLKPSLEFNYKATRTDGLAAYCKTCTRVESKQYQSNNKDISSQRNKINRNRYRNQNLLKPTVLTEKRCGTCKQIFPIAQFCKDNCTPDGFSHQCRQCRATSLRKSRQNVKYRRAVTQVVTTLLKQSANFKDFEKSLTGLREKQGVDIYLEKTFAENSRRITALKFGVGKSCFAIKGKAQYLFTYDGCEVGLDVSKIKQK